MATQFSAPYQSIYDASLARQRQSEARQRGLATQGAARYGVLSSGVAMIPQENITNRALQAEQQIGANVAEAAESERLQDKAFEQRKELMDKQAGISAAAAARERSMRRKDRRAQIGGQLLGGGLAVAGDYFLRDEE